MPSFNLHKRKAETYCPRYTESSYKKHTHPGADMKQGPPPVAHPTILQEEGTAASKVCHPWGEHEDGVDDVNPDNEDVDDVGEVATLGGEVFERKAVTEEAQGEANEEEDPHGIVYLQEGLPCPRCVLMGGRVDGRKVFRHGERGEKEGKQRGGGGELVGRGGFCHELILSEIMIINFQQNIVNDSLTNQNQFAFHVISHYPK